MKYCPKCKQKYTDEDNFCNDCGEKLLPLMVKEDKFKQDLKAAGNAAAEAVKDIMADERVQQAKEKAEELAAQAEEKLKNIDTEKLKESAKAAAEELKNLDSEKGKKVLEDVEKKLFGLPKTLLIAAAAVLLVVVAGGGMLMFSPEQQSQRFVKKYMEAYISLAKQSEVKADDLKRLDDFISKEERMSLEKQLASSGKNSSGAKLFSNFTGIDNWEFISVLIKDNTAYIRVKQEHSVLPGADVKKSGVIVRRYTLEKRDGDWKMLRSVTEYKKDSAALNKA